MRGAATEYTGHMYPTFSGRTWGTTGLNIHCVQKKTPTHVFDCNSGISWSIFILFRPMKTEINTLQYTYLMNWWRRNCVTLNVTKSLLHTFHRVKDEHWTTLLRSGKTTTFVLIITLAFLGRFLYIFVSVETGMNTLQTS